MSVPIYSDGVEEIARMALTSHRWLQADEFIASYFSKISKQISELFSHYSKYLKPAKKQQIDGNGKPVLSELPQNYILASDPSTSTFAIVGHPSGLHFQSAEQFLPHLHWLCNPDRFRTPCGCSLCASMQTPFNGEVSNQPNSSIYSNFFPGQNLQSQQHAQFFGSPFVTQQFPPSNFQIPISSPISKPHVQHLQGMNISQSQPTQVFQFEGPGGQVKSQLEIQTKLSSSARESQIASHKSPGIGSNASNTGPSSASGPKSSAEILNEFNMSVPIVSNGMGHQISSLNMSNNSTPALSAADSSIDSSIPEANQTSPAPTQAAVPEKGAKRQKSREAPRRESLNITEAKNKIAALDAENAALQSEVTALKADILKYETKNKRIRFEIDLLLPILFKETVAATKQKQEEGASDPVAHTSDIDSQSEVVEDDPTNDTPKIKKLKRKRPKLLDPNAPKRPANAFIMFAELQRVWIREEKRLIQKFKSDPDLVASLANTTKALGQKWRNLDEKIRTLYQDMFRDLVKQYDHDIKEYMTIHPNAPELGTTEPLPKDWTDPNAPKRPANAFFLFCEVEEDALKAKDKSWGTEKDLETVSLSLGERWLLLSEEERAGKFLKLMKGYEKLYQARLETFREYLEKEKQAAGVIQGQDAMQVDVIEQAATEDNDEDELAESGDELINNNHASPL